MASNSTSPNEDRSGVDGLKTLHTPAYDGHLTTVKKLIESHRVDVNAKDKDNNTALYRAGQNSHLDIVNYLLDHTNVDINAKNNGGKTILHIAASTGSLELVKILLKKGADVSAKDDTGLAPLPYAAKYGHLQVIKYFIEEIGVNVNVVCNFLARPLAAYYGHSEVVKYLATKEDVFLVTRNNIISLLCAVKNGHLDVVQALPTITLWYGDIEAYDLESRFGLAIHMSKIHEIPEEVVDLRIILLFYDTVFLSDDSIIAYVLILSIKSGYQDIFKHLVEQKHVNINAEFYNGSGGRILDYAAANGHLDIVEYLINKKGVDLNAATRNGMTPLLFAVDNNRLDVVKYLVGKGANINSKALVFAATTGNLNLIKYLVNHGASVNDEMESGFYFLANTVYDTIYDMSKAIWKNSNVRYYQGTALYIAVKYGHLDTVKYLIKKGATIKDDTLNDAAKNGHLDIVKYIVKKQQDNKQRVFNQQLDALYIAVEKCHLEIVKYLMSKTGQTTIYVQSQSFNNVVKNCHLDLVQYLVHHGTDFSNDSIFFAIASGNLDMVKYVLEEKGYNFKSVANAGSNLNLLHYAVRKGHLNIVKYFVEEKHLDFNSPYEDGTTPLQQAILYNRLDIAKYLVEEKHVDPEQNEIDLGWYNNYTDTFSYIVEKSNYGICNISKTNFDVCLNGAVETDNLNLLQHLVDNATSVDVNIETDKGKTLLYQAIQIGDFQMAKYLIDHGADVNAKSRIDFEYHNVTALHIAAAKGDQSLVEYLLNKGANINATTDLTPLGVANLCCNIENVKFLQSKGANRTRRNREFQDLPKVGTNAFYDDDNEKLYPLSGSSTRLSSWINVFAHTVVKGVMDVSKYIYSSFRPLPINDNNCQSSNSMAIGHNDVVSTLFLIDVFVRKFTGQEYISTAESSVSLTEATGVALVITEEFEKELRQVTKNNKISVDRLNIDFVKIQQEISRKIVTGEVNEIAQVLRLNAEKAFADIDLKYAEKKKLNSSMREIDIKVDKVLNKIMAKILGHQIINPLDQNVAREQQCSLNLQNYLNMSSRSDHELITN